MKRPLSFLILQLLLLILLGSLKSLLRSSPLSHKKINTNDLLQLRRPYKVLSSDICKLCMEHGESTNHLFLHCPLMMGLWHRLFCIAKMDWAPLRSIFDMMTINFKGLERSKRGLVLWQSACIALIWVVWWERNVRIFEDIWGQGKEFGGSMRHYSCPCFFLSFLHHNF